MNLKRQAFAAAALILAAGLSAPAHGAESKSAPGIAAAAADTDFSSARKGGGGGGGRHAGGGGGGGRHAGGGGGRHAGGGGGGGHRHASGGGNRHVNGGGARRNVNVNVNRRNVNVNRNVNVVGRRPYRGWVSRPYYGRAFAGITIGTIIAATAVGLAPVAPDPTLCWFWSDQAMVNGYWDYCTPPPY